MRFLPSTALFLLVLAPLNVRAEPARPLSAAELGAVSAGDAIHTAITTRQTVDAVSSNNRVTAGTVSSGEVNFSSSAFSGFSGVGNVVVNTGNNNSIQGTLSVTIAALPR